VVPIKFNKKKQNFEPIHQISVARICKHVNENPRGSLTIKNILAKIFLLWDQKCGYPHTDMRVVVLRYSNSRQMAAPAYMPIAHFPRHCRYRTCNKVLAVTSSFTGLLTNKSIFKS